MLDNLEVSFAVSSEVFGRIAADSPELVDRMVDIGSSVELEGSIGEGLDLLVDKTWA